MELRHTSKPNIAIVGGGLAGLSAAYFLARSPAFAGASINIFEASPRVGGWIRSTPIRLEDGRRVILEAGPRSIRPAGLGGWLGVRMIQELNLQSQVYTVSRKDPAGKNRYIYFKNQLNLLPASLSTLYRVASPLIVSLLPTFIRFWLSSKLYREKEKQDLQDESVEEFITRVFSKSVADDLVSAVIGGIYAGDIDTLSAKFLLGRVWETEAGRIKLPKDMTALELENDVKESIESHLRKKMEAASIWGLRGGLETFSKAIMQWLEQQPNVQIHLSEPITSLSFSPDTSMFVTPKSQHTHVIYALPLSHIPQTISLDLPHTDSQPAVSVSVVNFYFANSFKSLFPKLRPGFGYLIPRSVPPTENPHGVLGVCFDNFISPKIDNTSEVESTKITLISGGYHYHDQSVPIPSKERAIQNGLDTLRLHFPHSVIPEPDVALSYIHHDAIPQPTVGHVQRMKDLKATIGRRGWAGKVGFVSAGVHASAGINGAIETAWKTVKEWEQNML